MVHITFQAHLLCCIQLCLVKSTQITAKQGQDDDEDEETRVSTELENLMSSLTKRMITSEMEDFELV